MTNCAIAAKGATLNCDLAATPLAQGDVIELHPVITVDAAAPAGSYDGASTALRTVNATGTSSLNAYLSLIVAPNALAAPDVTSVDNASGSTVISGTGVAGANISMMDANDNVIGTTTVAADGTWSIDLGTDKSQNPEDLTVTQSLNGETSAAATIEAAALPIINPAVAAGAGLAALAGAGAFLLRRKLA